MQPELIRIDSDWDHPQASDLNASLASLPEKLACSNSCSHAAEASQKLADLSCKSVPEEIYVELESGRGLSREGLGMTLQSILDEVVDDVDDLRKEAKVASSKSLWQTQSTCVPSASHQRQECQSPRALDSVLADLESERALKLQMRTELEKAKAEIHDAQVCHLDASYRAEDVQRQLDIAKLQLDDAVMGRLDESYRAGVFKSELESAQDALENAVMDRMDASYEKEQLKEQLDAAKEHLEELLMERLDRDYVECGLEEQLSEAKQKMEDAVMQRLDASYDLGQVKVQLQSANVELEEAFMERLEASYVHGNYRAQLEDAKLQLEEAFQNRLEASLKRTHLLIHVKNLQDERDEARMHAEDLLYEAGKPMREGVESASETHAPSRAPGVERSNSKHVVSTVVRPPPERDALSVLLEPVAAQQSQNGLLQCEDKVEKTAATLPGRVGKAASPGPSRRPMGADAIMPAMRGQQRMRREVEEKAAQEKQVREKELQFRRRLRQRLVNKQRQEAIQRKMGKDPIFERRFGAAASVRQQSADSNQAKNPDRKLPGSVRVPRREDGHRNAAAIGGQLLQRPAIARCGPQGTAPAEQGPCLSAIPSHKASPRDGPRAAMGHSDLLRGAGDLMLKKPK